MYRVFSIWLDFEVYCYYLKNICIVIKCFLRIRFNKEYFVVFLFEYNDFFVGCFRDFIFLFFEYIKCLSEIFEVYLVVVYNFDIMVYVFNYFKYIFVYVV